jgi:hypothetical protein
MCYTTKCDTVEDGLMGHALEVNPEWIRRLTRCYCVTRVMSGGTGNLVVNFNVKKNVEEGLMMVSAELLEAWVRSGKAYSVSDKANGVI